MTAPAVLRHVYTPRGAVRTLLTRRDPEVLVAGPAGTGKSLGCLHKLAMAAMKYDGMRGLIVRKTAATLGATTLDTWRKHAIRPLIEAGKAHYYGGSSAEPAQYRFANGSVVVLGGLDKPSKIMSSEYDMAFVDEATETFLQDWEAIGTRLRNGRMPYQQLIGGCNPDAEHHFLKQRCNAGSTLLLESRHRDNPMLYDENGELTERGTAYMARLDALTGVRRLRLRDGLWVTAEGVVYDGWDPSVHLVDALPDGAEAWTRWWTVDFGYTNPFVLQCWAEDPDGRLWLYREMVRTQRMVEDHAREILKIVARGDGTWREPRPRAIVCDHDAANRAVLEKHLGMSTSAAQKTVTDGIEAMQARLRPAGDGRPRLFVLRGALVERDPAMVEAGKPMGLAQEIVGYRWAPDKDGKPAKEEPEKVDDHSMDAGRYMVAERDLGGRPRVRFIDPNARRIRR
jgi:phage terminase large subunit